MRAEYLDMSFPFSAGALYSTVDDLYRWGQALDAGRLISSEAYTRMTTITPLLTTYGYGLIMGNLHQPQNGRSRRRHQWIPCKLYPVPDEHACVIVLCNSEEPSFQGHKSFVCHFFGEDHEMPEEKSSDYCLRYPADVLRRGLRDRAGRDTGSREAQWEPARDLRPGQKPVLPQSDTLFSRDDDSITFHVSGNAVSHLTLSQAQTHTPQSKVEVEARKIEK